METSQFVTVVQRRQLTADQSLFPLLEPLFSIETHMSMEERLMLTSLGLQLPDRFVACEIGSYVGSSTCFLAVAAKMRRGVIHCVDTWDNRAMGSELPRDTYEEFRRNTVIYRDQIVEHRGVASSIGPAVPSSLDLLFVDGDHSYHGALADLRLYAPKLRHGGILALHDFNYPTVQTACAEYLTGRAFNEVATVHSLKVFQLFHKPEVT